MIMSTSMRHIGLATATYARLVGKAADVDGRLKLLWIGCGKGLLSSKRTLDIDEDRQFQFLNFHSFSVMSLAPRFEKM